MRLFPRSAKKFPRGRSGNPGVIAVAASQVRGAEIKCCRHGSRPLSPATVPCLGRAENYKARANLSRLSVSFGASDPVKRARGFLQHLSEEGHEFSVKQLSKAAPVFCLVA